MTADALLAAVRADPDSDLPRLVYADHLDDVGQPERAEFIRVQCELARLDEWDDRRPPLEDREHELLDRNEAAWLGNLRGMTEWEWRRGFVDEVSASTSEIEDVATGGYAGHPVRHVNVLPGRTPEDWRSLPEPGSWLAGVRRLSLAHHRLVAADLRQFLSSDRLAGLQALDLSHNQALGDLPELLAGSSCLVTLRELSAGGRHPVVALDGTRPFDANRLAAVLADAPLEKLHLSDAHLDTDRLGILLAAPFAERLTELDMSDNAPDLPVADVFGRLSTGSRLERLEVSGMQTAGLPLGDLLAVRGLSRLRHLEAGRCGWVDGLAESDFWQRAASLRLHSSGLTAEAIAPLVAAGPPLLRLLDLADNALGPSGASRLTRAGWVGSLTWLALSRNRFDARAVEYLFSGLWESHPTPHLRTLHLAHNPLTDRSVGLLTTNRRLAQLSILTLSYTNITDRAVPELLDAPFRSMSGLGLAGCNLSATGVNELAVSPGLRRLQWLDLSDNPQLCGDVLRPLAASRHLSPLCELDVGGIDLSDRTRAALRERLGKRLSD